MDYVWYFCSVLLALLQTLIIEIPLYWLFKRHNSIKYIITISVVTSITNIVMNISMIYIKLNHPNQNDIIYLYIPFEIGALLVESFSIFYFLKNKAFLVSLIANAASLLLGIVLNYFISMLVEINLYALIIILIIYAISFLIEYFFIIKASVHDN